MTARRTSVPAVALAAVLAAVPAAAAAPAPRYRAHIDPLSRAERARMTPSVWRPGCPVGLDRLRAVRVRYWDFAGRVRTGTLVVRADVALPVVRAFGRIFAARFPIRRMRPIEAYGGSDFRSIEADNTSAFNCRPATGSTRWSDHALGVAIDLNPLENPYVAGGATSHRASRPYLDRARSREGMTREGDAVTRAFASIGWGWGGRWPGPTDYQHFSIDGR